MTDARADLPMDESPQGAVLDAQLHLLDRQIVDREGVPIATVDDLELDGVEAGQTPRIGALLSGAALWTRTFGGHPRRHHLEQEPWQEIAEVGVVIRMSRSAADYEASWPEDWAREQVIARIPGGRHAPD
jgi:hypothetical protein